MTEATRSTHPPSVKVRLNAALFGLSCITDMVKQLRPPDNKLLEESGFQQAVERLQRVSAQVGGVLIVDECWEDVGYGGKRDEGVYTAYGIPAVFIYGQPLDGKLKMVEVLSGREGNRHNVTGGRTEDGRTYEEGTTGVSGGANVHGQRGVSENSNYTQNSTALNLNTRVEELEAETKALVHKIDWLEEKSKRLRAMLMGHINDEKPVA